MRYSCKGDSSQRQLNLTAAASPDVLRSAAEAGAEIVRTAVQGQISSQAKNPTGKLLSSITYRSWSNEASSGAMLGWAKDCRSARRLSQSWSKPCGAFNGRLRAYLGVFVEARPATL